MPRSKTKSTLSRSTSSRAASKRSVEADVRATLAWLERRGTQRNREGMARYGIVTKKAFGVSMATMRGLIKRLGKNHDLALALWETGWHEARILASFVDEPARVTPPQMDRWCRDFDNWAVCDSLCFHLFDRTPHAFRKVETWSTRQSEFVKRAAFALLAGLAVHDKKAEDEAFSRGLELIEEAADDRRNFVKKSVNWALRSIGKRNLKLNAKALAVARRLAGSPDATRRWVGKDALRELTSDAVRKRLAAREAREKRKRE